MPKLDLPNESLTNNNLTAEATYLITLYNTKPRSSTGQASYVSTTSGITYTTTGSAYDSQGQEGLLQLLQLALANYDITATDYNTVVNRITEVENDVNSHLALDASETVKGHVELATSAETTAGTSTSLAVHPAGLKVETDKKINHSLATAASDFLVSSGVGIFIKKTLDEVKTLLGLGSAAYTASTDYATSAQGTLATNAIPSSQKSAPNGVAPLGADTKVPLTYMSSTFITGAFTGNGSASQFIDVGFVPSCVIVVCATSGQYGNKYAMVATGATSYLVGTHTALDIYSTGFRAYYDISDGSLINHVFFNESAAVSRYIVFR